MTVRARALACALLVSSSALLAAAWIEGGHLRAALHAYCAPLRVLDRHGVVVRERLLACGPPARGRTVALGAVPLLMTRVAVAAEDRRFGFHFGVDPLAIARAALANLRERRVVSGASTLSMQLVRMLRPDAPPHTFAGKLEQAWLAFALELRAQKTEILEGYLNFAYFGAGAYGAADAAETYFGKRLSALNRGQACLLALLPRSPNGYDLRRHLDRALARRADVLAQMVAHGSLSARERNAIEAEPIALAAAREDRPRAGHFVDWVLSELPERERSAGGTLRTTLDSALEEKLEAAVAEHVARLASSGIDEAGVVVLDAASGEVRAMVGSRDYARSALNAITRRRRLGSVLKPFAYALAVEAGASADSLALDVGDIESEYRARDWVGREAGPIAYREALAGSYNLAAVHVLERVGTATLQARLRAAGVAELPAPAARYGLPLALGAARARLLDVVAAYGFLVREGFVRPARGIAGIEREAGQRFVPADPGEQRLFTSEASAIVMDMLSDPAARHRRFGRGLPIDLEPPVVAKTGTASGMSDLSAILACREYMVGAWTGRFDGAPTRGMSGMWAAAPLARRALEIALAGKAPSLPARPYALSATRAATDAAALQPPPELEAWASRARALGARAVRSPR